MKRALLLGAALSCILASGVSAASDPPAGWVDRVYLEFSAKHARGQVLVDQVGPHSARVTAALGKLMPGHDYLLMFSTDTCSTPLNQADIGATFNLKASQAGTSFQSVVDTSDLAIWRYARSARLMEEEGIYYFCVDPRRLHGMPETVEGRTGRLSNGSHKGLLDVNAQTNKLTLSMRGLAANVRYSVVLSPLTCPQFTDGDPDQPIVIGSVRADASGNALGRTETVDKDETITISRSARVERQGSGAVWACVPLKSYAAWPATS